MIDTTEPEHGYCQICGTWIDDENLYVTSKGAVYCDECGSHVQREIDDLEDSEEQLYTERSDAEDDEDDEDDEALMDEWYGYEDDEDD